MKAAGGAISGRGASGGSILMPDYQSYAGTPSYISSMKLRSNVPSFLADNELRMEILKRQLFCITQVVVGRN